MIYTEMTCEHVAHIAEIEKICFSDPWSVQSISSEINNPLACWLVALDGDQVAGYIGSQSVLGWADVMNLAVDPDFRRKGIGEALVLELIGRLKKDGVSVLTLEVRGSNAPAISLYQKLGFTEVGRRPNYYHHPKEDALIMRKEWAV